MTSESMKLYKLIILYFLSKTSQPMSNAIISDFMLENCYADYFSIQQTLSDLTEDNMINTEQTHSKSYYTIAPKGQETLDFFGNKLPNDTKQQIEDYLVKNKVSIIENTTLHTDFTRLRNKEYLAKCSILERGSVIMEVAINVPSEEEAIQVCQRFKDKNEQIYGFLFRTLSED